MLALSGRAAVISHKTAAAELSMGDYRRGVNAFNLETVVMGAVLPQKEEQQGRKCTKA